MTILLWVIGVFLAFTVVLIVWPIIGAVSYRFGNWLLDDEYIEKDAKEFIRLGPITFFLVFLAIYIRTFEKHVKELHRAAGAPEQKDAPREGEAK
jgi:uncharacterized BrkB/YihY/UPF0761 family membrane protein